MTAIVKVQQRLGGGLGASQVAAALGLSPWKAPIVLWQEMCGLIPPSQAGEPAEWGTKLEPLIRAEFVERHGVDVEVPRESMFHPEVPWARCTPDGYILKAQADDEVGPLHLRRVSLLECKAPGLRQADAWIDGTTIPDYYVCQAVWSMWITGLRRVDFAVLLGGQRYFEIPLHHDAELEADIVTSATEFWGHVQSQSPPRVDGTDSHAQYLKLKLAKASATVPATPEIDRLVSSWREDECEMKRIKTRVSMTKNLVLDRMVQQNAQRVMTTNGPIAMTAPGSERDWEALADSYAKRLISVGVPANVDEDIKPFTTTKDVGSLRRPNTWTKES